VGTVVTAHTSSAEGGALNISVGFLQDVRHAASGVAPARDEALIVLKRLPAVSHSDDGHILVEGDGLGQLEESHVVRVGAGASVAGVHYDAGEAVALRRALALTTDVMCSQYNRQAADPGADAVCRGDEPVGADEGGTARVGAADLQRCLPRVLAWEVDVFAVDYVRQTCSGDSGRSLDVKLVRPTSAVRLILPLPTILGPIANKSVVNTSTFSTEHLTVRAACTASHFVLSLAAIWFPVTLPGVWYAAPLQAAELIFLASWETALSLVLTVLAVNQGVTHLVCGQTATSTNQAGNAADGVVLCRKRARV